jgi:hypothetical protein
MNTTVLLAILGSNVVSLVAGIVVHAWSARQKSPTLRIDEIKAAAALLASAAKAATDEVQIATERKQATDLALAQAATHLSAINVSK